MKHGLTCTLVHIEHGSVPGLMRSPFPGDPRSRLKHMAHKCIVGGTELIQRGDVFLRDDQNVNGRLRIDIFESHDILVFVHFRRRDLAGNDFAKQALRHEDTVSQLADSRNERLEAGADFPNYERHRNQNDRQCQRGESEKGEPGAKVVLIRLSPC